MKSTKRLEELLAQSVNPLSAQELHDEEFIKMKPRTKAQGRTDKALLEELLRRRPNGKIETTK